MNENVDFRKYLEQYANTAKVAKSLGHEDMDGRRKELNEQIKNAEKKINEITNVDAKEFEKMSKKYMEIIKNSEKEIEEIDIEKVERAENINKDEEIKAKYQEKNNIVNYAKAEYETAKKVREAMEKNAERPLIDKKKEKQNFEKQLKDMLDMEAKEPKKVKNTKYKEFLDNKIKALDEEIKNLEPKINEKVEEEKNKTKILNDNYRKFLLNIGKIDRGEELLPMSEDIRHQKNDANKNRIDSLKKDIEKLKNRIQNTTDPTKRATYERLLKEKEKEIEEILKQNQAKDEKSQSSKPNEQKEILGIEDKQKKVLGIEDKQKEILGIEDKQKNEKINSGLQVYRDIYNEIPEIKGKHLLSTNPLITQIPVIGVALKPIVKLVTGRKKITQKVYEEIAKKSPEDIELLADFLDERTINDLKVNEIFLDAFGKKLVEMRNQERPQLEQSSKEYNEKIEDARGKYEEYIKNGQFEKAKVIEEQIGKWEEKVQENNKRIDKLEDRIRFTRLGKEEKSLMKRGNIRGWIFAKRNPKHKEALAAINELADIEKEKLKAEKANNKMAASKYRQEMDEYADSKTKNVKFLGKKISRGVFDKPSGERRVISDSLDNRIRNAYLAMMAIGGAVASAVEIAKQNQIANDAIQNQQEFGEKINQIKDSIKDKDIENSITQSGRHVNNVNAASEYANLEFSGGRTDVPEYVAGDEKVNEFVNNFAQNVTDKMTNARGRTGNNNLDTFIENINMDIENKINARSVVEKFQEGAKIPKDTMVNHDMGIKYGKDALKYEDAYIETQRKIIEILKKVKELSQSASKKIEANFIGPTISMLTSPTSKLQEKVQQENQNSKVGKNKKDNKQQKGER